MNKKICFVAMGFGKKMDYRNSKEVDLDIIYNKVIKSLFANLYEYELIRADEIAGSSIIDVSMYKLLLEADLVVADISTMNLNAIYELGIRHALKPFSTIIMMQETDAKAIPFDISHCRILTYKDYGEYLDDNEAKVIKSKLHSFILASEKKEIDSPFYTYLPSIQPPTISDSELDKLIDSVKESEETIRYLVTKAEGLKKESNFSEASIAWRKLCDLLPNNDYVIQQLALSQYKSKLPNESIALELALETIKTLNPKTSLDLETLGITAAIYKNLFRLNNNYDYLDEAIDYYKKGYIIKKDYYTGENYSACLLLKTTMDGLSDDEFNYLKYESRTICKNVISQLEYKILEGDVNYWMYASLAVCCFTVQDYDKFKSYDEKFRNSTTALWEINTYEKSIDEIKKIIQV